jgi:hypothetical protein
MAKAQRPTAGKRTSTANVKGKAKQQHGQQKKVTAQAKLAQQRNVQTIVQNSVLDETLGKIWKRTRNDTDIALRVWHSIEAGYMDAVDEDMTRLPKCENKFSLMSREHVLDVCESLGLPDMKSIKRTAKKVEVAKVLAWYLNVSLTCAVPSRVISVLKSRCRVRYEGQGRKGLTLKYVEEKPGAKRTSLKADFADSICKLGPIDASQGRVLKFIYVPSNTEHAFPEDLLATKGTQLGNPWSAYSCCLT